jgi:hypothetical protein
MDQVEAMPNDVNLHSEVQCLLEEALRLLDEANLARPAAYAQMALDCLCSGDPDQLEEG